MEELAQSVSAAKIPGKRDWDVARAVCAGESRALPPPGLQSPDHSVALGGTGEVFRRFDRDTARLAMLVMGILVSAALVLAVLVQDPHPKAADLSDEARQAGGDLLLDANRLGTPFEVVGLNGKRFTGETPARLEHLDPGSYTVYLRPEKSPEYEQTAQINSGEAINASHVFNVTSQQEIPSPPRKHVAWTIIPVVVSKP